MDGTVKGKGFELNDEDQPRPLKIEGFVNGQAICLLITLQAMLGDFYDK